MKYKIKRLDFNIAYACNLSCKGCISLSDLNRKGVESLSSIEQQCKEWSHILSPKIISIFGGEPLLHPKLLDVLKLIRIYWPRSTIRLITNGYFLKNYNPMDWFTFSNFEMQISIHRKDHEKILTNEIQKILKCKNNWKVYKDKNSKHIDIGFVYKDFKIYKSRFKNFVIPYKFENENILPFRSDPIKSHSICGSPDTPILYKNKVYKCAPIANILDIVNNKKNYNYQGIKSTEDLKDFIDNINKPEKICAMCPESTKHSIDHFKKENVYVKDLD